MSAAVETPLNASADRVWGLLTAPRFYPLWLTDWKLVRSISTPRTGPGTTFEILPHGRQAFQSWIVAEWEPPQRLRLAEYRQDLQIIFRLTPRGDTTLLAIEQQWPTGRGILRFLPPLKQQRLLQQTAAQLQELFALNQDIKLLHGMGDE